MKTIMRNRITDDYFEWIFDMLCANKYAPGISFRRLIRHLHSIPFSYTIPCDVNRAKDGIDLRWKYSLIQGWDEVPECLDGPCSVLEMMVALSIRCEEHIMDNPLIGDRTRQWFWGMIRNLGIGYMSDDFYNPDLVDEVIDRLLNREYEPDGTGGLFQIKNTTRDLRMEEIWKQANWYFNTVYIE